jgi:hypothetical protein
VIVDGLRFGKVLTTSSSQQRQLKVVHITWNMSRRGSIPEADIDLALVLAGYAFAAYEKSVRSRLTIRQLHSSTAFTICNKTYLWLVYCSQIYH